MPTGLDLLNDEKVGKSVSGLNLLEEVTPTSTPPVKSDPKYKELRNYFENRQPPWMVPNFGNLPVSELGTPAPPGGWDKEGNPLDEKGVAYGTVELPKKYTTEPGLYNEPKRSFFQKMGDEVKKLFTTQAEEKAKATYSIVMAEQLGVRPSDISPDLYTAFMGGFGNSVTGLVKQVKSGKKFPKINPKAIEAMPDVPRRITQAGQIIGDLPFMAAGAFAGGGTPITALAGAFAVPEGLRALYSYELEHGDINTPEKFIDALEKSTVATGKGLVTGAATGLVGGATAPLGAIPRLGAEAMTMSTVGAALEGKLPTAQEIGDAAMLVVGLHGATNVPKVARNIKTFWTKTGQMPIDIVTDAQGEPKLAEWLVKGGEIPEDVLKKAQDKVTETAKIQEELALKDAMKFPIDINALIVEELMEKGRRIEEVKKEKSSVTVEETPKSAQNLVDERSNEQKATDLGIKFNGVQKLPNGQEFPIFTDNETGSSFSVKEGESVEVGLGRVRERFKAADKAKETTPMDEEVELTVPKELEETHPLRDTDVEHTNTMSKIFKEKVQKTSSPETYTRYLINEVNRYLNGEEVDIDAVRNGLSELATRVDEVEQSFDNPLYFQQWKKTVSEAARWARNVDRLKIKQITGIPDISVEDAKVAKEQVVKELATMAKDDPMRDAREIQLEQYNEIIEGKKKYKDFQPTLYSGVDPVAGTKAIVDAAKRARDYVKHARSMKEFKPGSAYKMAKEELTRSVVDRSGNIRRELLDNLSEEGSRIIQKMYLSKGASARSAELLRQMRKEVYSGLNGEERRVLDTVILMDRMLDIGKYKTAKQFNFPKGASPVEAAAYRELYQYVEKLTPEMAQKIERKAQAYFEWMKKPLKDMLDSGLLSQEEYDRLVSHNYRRIKLVDVYDRRYSAKVGKTKRTIYDSGVEALSKGRDTDIFEPSSEIMALEVFNRAYGRIMNNEANLALLDLARNHADNPFVRIKEERGDKIPSGWNRIFVYESGERKALYISPEMSKEWITNSPEISYKLGQVLRWVSLSPVLRTFATGINWGFALANMPRDVMHAWYAARTFENGKWKSLYSNFLPQFVGEIGHDISSVALDAILRKGRYQDYINEGGGMEFLVHQGRLLQRGRHIEGGLDKVLDFLGYFGETSEVMTRLAIRERALRRGKSSREATFAARDYMDFAQGGGVVKAVDNAIPYLNASVQGTRGLLRAFKDSPIESTWKLAQFGALVTGLYIASHKYSPQTMQSLQGSIDLQNNLIVPFGDQFSYVDERGQTRYPYLKIPLDPGQKFFKVFFEASTDKWLGNEIDVDRVTGSLTALSPVGISSLPPTLSATLGYIQNKNYWLNKEIWSSQESGGPYDYPKSGEEFIPGKTPQAMVDIGKLTGLSPERTKYAIEQLITKDNIFTTLGGGMYEKVFGEVPKVEKEFILAEALANTPGIRRFIGVTNPYSRFAQGIKEVRQEADLERFKQNRGLDAKFEGYLAGKVTRQEIFQYMQSFKDRDVYNRLKERFKFSEKVKELPNRAFWLSLKGIESAEARARIYLDRLDKASPEEKEQIMKKELPIVLRAGGVISDEFRRKVMELKNQE